MFRFLKRTKLKYLQTRATYFHPRGKSTLDHIYTNADHVSEYGVLNDMNGDHAPVYVVKKQPTVLKIKGSKQITCRSYKDYSSDAVKEYVAACDWDMPDDPNPDSLVEQLVTKITEYLDLNHPLKKNQN